jgi:carbamate kinase
MGHRLVIALGGNAITRPGGPADISAQFEQTAQSTRWLVDLLDAGHHVVITHGNGPQVGSTYRRSELAASEVYPLPLEICVASTQGGMGYMIAQCLHNELQVRGRPRGVTAIVTTVVVDAADPAFKDPTKPIGPYLGPELARARAAEGITIKPAGKDKYRRVVASPRPTQILESGAIRRLVDAGELIVACGGGGIPVARDHEGQLRGIAAVVDKDLASALLAVEIDADALLILTAAEQVCIRYEQPGQQALGRMTVGQARSHLAAGEFPPGSMGPKIEAAILFLEASRRPQPEVIITTPEKALEAMQGRAGTRLTRGS